MAAAFFFMVQLNPFQLGSAGNYDLQLGPENILIINNTEVFLFASKGTIMSIE